MTADERFKIINRRCDYEYVKNDNTLHKVKKDYKELFDCSTFRVIDDLEELVGVLNGQEAEITAQKHLAKYYRLKLKKVERELYCIKKTCEFLGRDVRCDKEWYGEK